MRDGDDIKMLNSNVILTQLTLISTILSAAFCHFVQPVDYVLQHRNGLYGALDVNSAWSVDRSVPALYIDPAFAYNYGEYAAPYAGPYAATYTAPYAVSAPEHVVYATVPEYKYVVTEDIPPAISWQEITKFHGGDSRKIYHGVTYSPPLLAHEIHNPAPLAPKAEHNRPITVWADYAPNYNNQNIPVEHKETAPEKSYKFAYTNKDSSRQEEADHLGNIEGQYSYTDEEGTQHDVSYIAGDKTGFVVTGEKKTLNHNKDVSVPSSDILPPTLDGGYLPPTVDSTYLPPTVDSTYLPPAVDSLSTYLPPT